MCMHIYIYICIHTHTHACICVHVCVYIYIYVHTYNRGTSCLSLILFMPDWSLSLSLFNRHPGVGLSPDSCSYDRGHAAKPHPQ